MSSVNLYVKIGCTFVKPKLINQQSSVGTMLVDVVSGEPPLNEHP